MYPIDVYARAIVRRNTGIPATVREYLKKVNGLESTTEDSIGASAKDQLFVSFLCPHEWSERGRSIRT